MANLGNAFRDLGTLDALGMHDSFVHRLDPRAKVLATAGFTVAVAAMGRYEVSALLPFSLFPALLAVQAGISWAYLLKRIALALPFVLVLGMLNPLQDRQVLLQVGPIGISGGWLSFASMTLRLALTVASAVVLVATTGLDGVCLALDRLGLPRIFVLQIGFLHRYAFVLAEEAEGMLRARELRAHGHGLVLREFGPLAGHLLLRTWDRAGRIHQAMLARGFEGQIHLQRQLHFGRPDALFLLGWCSLFALFHLVQVPRLQEALLSVGFR